MILSHVASHVTDIHLPLLRIGQKQLTVESMIRIHGLNKLSLVDYPGKMSAIIFTGSCNFRCPFCHNSSLVLDPDSQPVISEEEVLGYLSKRRKLLDGVVVTGGEPTVHSQLPALIRKIRELGLLVKLDTNGSNPEMLSSLIDSRLVDYVAMDIKNSPDAYAETTGCPSLDLAPVLRSIEILKEGRVDYEFRTTVIKGLHYRENIEKICTLISPCRRYFLQTFVPSQDTIAQGLEAPDSDTMKTYLKLVRTYIGNAEIRDSKD